MKEKIYNLFDEQVPDDFAKILSQKQKERRFDYMEKKTNHWGLFWKLAIAVFLIVIMGGMIFSYQSNQLYSTIELDVNPSIEIKVNKKDRVISCTALNEDAKDIIKDMDFKDADIDLALNAIIGSMVTKGYLNDITNSILISVDNKDEKEAEALRQRLSSKIDAILNSDKIEGSVLSQTITNKQSEAEEIADKYHISLGKAEYILEVIKNRPLLKVEDLVNLSINEINVLTQGAEVNINKQGNASTKAYIGEDKAKEIAFNHAGVKNPEYVEVEFDTEDGLIIYEVEFYDNTYEYDYEINAIDGTIIKNNKEKEDKKDNNVVTGNYISETKAKEIALNHAGVKNPTNLTIELDREDNEYSVEFYDDTYEYDYEINATTGKIIKYDKERENKPTTNNTKYISEAKAKEIALNHAGVKNPTNLTIELDSEDNEYSVEFYNNGYEYDYEINATTGKIIKYDKERDHD